jgi:hypothetical protein
MLLTHPMSGTEYQTDPRTCTAITGSASGAAFASPLVMKPGSAPGRLGPWISMTRCVTTDDSPDSSW